MSRHWVVRRLLLRPFLLFAMHCSTPSPENVGQPDAGGFSDSGTVRPEEDAGRLVDAGEEDAAAIADGGPPGSDAGADAAPPVVGVRYVGRYEDAVGGKRVGWPGARIVVRFEGTQLEATLVGVNGVSGGPSYYDVVVDGTVSALPLIVPAGTNSVTVATGLMAGVHVVELVKRTEAAYGTTQFAEFRFPGGGRLLPPPPTPSRRIEVMGNSAIDGYGIEGASSACAATAPTHNARKSAPFLSAIDLNADLVLLGHGGKGVLVNVTPGDTLTFPGLFERTLPNSPTPLWAHASWIPDAFVLFASNTDVENTSDTALNDGYTTFIAGVRAVYPAAHLFVVVSAYSTNDYPVGANTRTRLTAMTQEVVRRRAMAGDSRVYAYAMTEYLPMQLSACETHPGTSLHRQMANELVGWMRARLSW